MDERGQRDNPSDGPEGPDPDKTSHEFMEGETIVPGTHGGTRGSRPLSDDTEAETIVPGVNKPNKPNKPRAMSHDSEAMTIASGSHEIKTDPDATLVDADADTSAGSPNRPNRAATPMPEQIGSYRVLDVIGEGGMGCVYLAEQDSPKRKVALKVIRPGLANAELLRRFEMEAQVLGLLQHPGIAQIYEAGTADTGFGPQPYFAMEYVEGSPLLGYVEDKALGTRARLELFSRICDAVHHAHQKGIIHRDLKPANILVDHQGQPKILDFGVARATEVDAQQATMMTDVGQLVGTVPYMSPEQVGANPEDLDIRSDVYALGVILYEMLAGKLPYSLEKKMIHEAVRIIREQEPVKLSQYSRVFRGDVETIANKALEKERERRYQGANDLADDIRRYLTDVPIIARPPSARYQMGKFAKRNKALVGGAAAVVLALIVGLITTVFFWLSAIEARNDARFAAAEAIRERDRAEESENRAILARERAETAEEEAVEQRDRAVLAERDAVEQRDRAVIAEEEAVAQRDIAQEQREIAVSERAEAVRQATIATSVNEFLNEDLLAAADPGKRGRNVTVRDILDSAKLTVQKFEDQPLIDASIRSTLGRTYRKLGVYIEAEPQLVRAYNLLKQTLPPNHPDTITAQLEIARLYQNMGRFDEAEATYEEVIAARTALFGDDAPETAEAKADLAGLYNDQQRFASAEPLLLRTLDHQLQTLGEGNPATARTMHQLATLYIQEGRYDDAEPLLEKVLRVQKRLMGDRNPETLKTEASIADMYSARGRNDLAVPMFVRVLNTRKDVLGPEHPETLQSMNALAELYREQGRLKDAERISVEVVEIARRVLQDEHPDTLAYKAELGMIYTDQRRHEEAEVLFKQAYDGAIASLPPEHPDPTRYRSLYAISLRNQGRYGEAEPLLIEAHRNLLAAYGPENENTRRVVRALVSLYFATNNNTQADVWRARLKETE